MEYIKSNITILIVDDTPENISILGSYLADYNVKVALNGSQALNLIDSGFVPAIILLDVVMPGMDGYEVCRQLKKNLFTKDVPVIFITSMSDVTDKLKGFQAGAVDYITKPFQPEEVKSRIKTHVTLSLYRNELENVNNTLELKVAERTHELLLAKEKAEEASKLKSHFLALMSHELRTPMVGILGYSEVLTEEVSDPVLSEYIANLSESAHRMKDTLESILTLSSLEAHSKSINPSLFNMGERIEELSIVHNLAAARKGLTLSITNSLIDSRLITDQTMFDIIFNNLVSNAVKYTQKGGIDIEIFNELIDGMKYFCFKVSDTGIGIPKEKHSIIFEEFRQVYEGMKRNFEGVGLGLSLVKKYVDKLNGTLTLESEVGKGSVFTIKIKSWEHIKLLPKPKIKESISEISCPNIKNFRPRVLVVEDDRINAEITKHFLRDTADLEIASDGASAIQLAKNNKYDAILMDINLGKGLSGIEVTKVIRHFDQYQETPIIAYTAFAMENDQQSFLEEGCSHYMPKPYSKKDLVDMINGVISNDSEEP